jgi:hypothetical protein
VTHPPGTIIVPCQDLARYHRFTSSLVNLEQPTGSRVVLGVGQSIVDNLNMAIRALRPQDAWVWALGDDHTFEPSMLMRLLDRGLDVVAPLCTKRGAPFGLVHYQEQISDTPYHKAVQFNEIPNVPFEVEWTGSALLIRRDVLDEIGDPWYSNEDGAGRLTEDKSICLKARAHGYRVMIDPDLSLGHIGHVVARAERQGGVWGLTLRLGDQSLHFPGGIKDGSLGTLEAALA